MMTTGHALATHLPVATFNVYPLFSLPCIYSPLLRPFKLDYHYFLVRHSPHTSSLTWSGILAMSDSTIQDREHARISGTISQEVLTAFWEEVGG